MVELVYDDVYQARYAELLEVVERLEQEVEPMAAADRFAFEAGLSSYDLQRILRCRDRWPHWREERFVPPFLVQKLMLRDGHYGSEAQRRWAPAP